MQEQSSASLFGNEEGCAASKARDLLSAAAGAAKPELLSEARSLSMAVLPLNDLPAMHAAPAPAPSTPLPPIQVGFWILSSMMQAYLSPL